MATSTQMKKLKKYWKLTIIVENNFFKLPVTIAKIVLTREQSLIHAQKLGCNHNDESVGMDVVHPPQLHNPFHILGIRSDQPVLVIVIQLHRHRVK